ncbi:MAG: hypothetical protein RIQ79_802, partial [Verrucomicrobiota bacterium]
VYAPSARAVQLPLKARASIIPNPAALFIQLWEVKHVKPARLLLLLRNLPQRLLSPSLPQRLPRLSRP